MYESYDEMNSAGRQRRPARKVWTVIFGVAAVLLILMQTLYFLFNERSGYEYIADWLLYAVNAAILACAFFFLFFLLRGQKAPVLASAIFFSLLFCLNIALMIQNGFNTASVVTLSPNIRHMTVLKQDNDTGKVTVYRNPLLLFARLYEQLPVTVKGDIKTQWLNSDVCAVTYRDDARNLRQYVATYGDRGISYYYVSAAIRGKWAFFSRNGDGKTLTADEEGITVKDADYERLYPYDDCVQFGTLALVLYRDGKPEWTLALNEDCRVVDGLGILDDGGTITLCEVSGGKTAPFVYNRTENPLADALRQQKQEEAKAPEPIATPQPTQPPSADLSSLAKYSTLYGVMELQTDSADVFEVGRLALREAQKQTGMTDQDMQLQITRMTLLAGDINEFLMSVKANGGNLMGDIPEFEWTFRIRKGSGVYGAVHVSGPVDAAEGLTTLDTPQVKDTSGDLAYFMYIPAALTPEKEQEGLAAAQILADTLTDSPALADFDSRQGLVKVQTDSADLFMVTRMALEEHLKQFAVNGFDNDVQITKIVLLAGDENEFLAKVFADNFVSGQQSAEASQYVPMLRIKKGEGAYLAMVSGYDTINAAGLIALDPQPVKDVSQDAAYHFFVPAA